MIRRVVAGSVTALTVPDVLPGPGDPPLAVLFCGINPDDEVRAGGARLRALVATVAPRWLAVVGITAYRVAFAAPRAVVGRQETTLGDTHICCCRTRAA